MKKRVILLLFFLCCGLTAQSLYDELHRAGFEQLRIKEENRILYLGYENNRYRNESRALYEILLVINSYQPKVERVELLIYNNGIPTTTVQIRLTQLSKVLSGEITADTFIKDSHFSMNTQNIVNKLSNVSAQHKIYHKADVSFGLHIDYQLGNFINGVREKVYLIPNLETKPWYGATLNQSYKMVIWNDYNAENYSRPNQTRFTQNVKFLGNTYAQLTAGFFSKNRMGFDAEIYRQFFEESIGLHMRYSETRYGYLRKDFTQRISTPFIQSFSVGVNYRLRKYNTDLKISYQKYLAQDKGIDLQLTRQFNEVFISMFFKKTDLGKVAGFKFRVPLVGKKYLKPNRLRLRPFDYFELPYKYTGRSNIGIDFQNGATNITELSFYYPSLLKYEIKYILQKN